MTCRPWNHNLRIRLDRFPFVHQCRTCLQCWDGIDSEGRPVGEPHHVDPTEPIEEAVLKKANKK